MRMIAALALIGACTPAFAQGPAPAAPAPAATTAAAKPAVAAKPAPAKPAVPKSAYETAPLAERMALQSDLVWTGDLNSIADGAWGERSTAAVKAYQKRRGFKETGTLVPEERAMLAADAKTKQAIAGWLMIEDVNGTRLGIPSKLVPQMAKGKTGGTHWQSASGDIQIDTFRQPSPATLAVVHGIERKNPGRKVTYDVLKPDFFVLSGTQGPKKFYMRAQAGNGDVRGVIVTYDPAAESTMAPILVAISGSLLPAPPAVVAGVSAPVRRKVEYATGVVVGAAGDIVTDREAIDGCQVIVVNGLGNAERIADDKTAGLALIRVYGARDLRPLAFGGAAKGDVMLVGIPDPQAQGGNAAATITKARVLAGNDTNTLEPAPTQGLAGAAAIDAETGFAGIVVQRLQVVAGPASGAASSIASVEALRKLLAAQNATPANGAATAENAKDSVVRVICVRK